VTSKSQNSYFLAETFDIAEVAVTYSATLGSAKYTAGVNYYARLDPNGPINSLNGFLSCLWAPGTGSAGTVYFGLYQAVPGTSGESNGVLDLIGAVANVGGVAAGMIRKQIFAPASGIAGSVALSSLAFPAQGNPLGGVSTGVYYASILVKTDAGTDHVDCATSTAFAANSVANTDPTGGGGWPRAFTGAGTSLTTLPVTEAISGVTASTLCPYFAID
jgi:hypothetical protein